MDDGSSDTEDELGKDDDTGGKFRTKFVQLDEEFRPEVKARY